MNRKYQSGVVTVEWAIIGAVFLLITMGAVEMSRLLFTWNTLDAVVQRAVRLAAVCPPNHSAIFNVASFGTAATPANYLPGFTAANIQVTYLDENFVDTGGADPIEFVRGQIVNYSMNLALPVLNNIPVPSPSFVAIIPAESLGFIPGTSTRLCFNTAS